MVIAILGGVNQQNAKKYGFNYKVVNYSKTSGIVNETQYQIFSYVGICKILALILYQKNEATDPKDTRLIITVDGTVFADEGGYSLGISNNAPNPIVLIPKCSPSMGQSEFDPETIANASGFCIFNATDKSTVDIPPLKNVVMTYGVGASGENQELKADIFYAPKEEE